MSEDTTNREFIRQVRQHFAGSSMANWNIGEGIAKELARLFKDNKSLREELEGVLK